MTDYRVYFLDRNGAIMTADWIVADNDDEAANLAKNDPRYIRCELWEKKLFVKSLSITEVP